MLKCNEIQMAVIRSKFQRIPAFFVMDQFDMMSPLHLLFQLGAEGIIDGATTVQKLRWS